MEPLNDEQLSDLLRRWTAPAAPPDLERRIFGEPNRQRWHGWLLRGSIRVPVPVLALLVVALFVFPFVLPRVRQPATPAVPELRLSDFQPVAELKPRIIRKVYEGN